MMILLEQKQDEMWLPNDTGYFPFLVVDMASCTGFIVLRAPTKWLSRSYAHPEGVPTVK